MQTIEYFLQGKKLDQRLNEDGLFQSEHLIAVIDGVTMGRWNVWHGDTGGLFSKNVLMTFLEDETRRGEEIVKKREEKAAELAALEAAGEIGENGESPEEEEGQEQEPEEIPIWEMTPEDFFHSLNNAMRKMAEKCLEAQQEKHLAAPTYGLIDIIEYPRASVIVYNDYYHEIWSYGGCNCRIGDKVYSHARELNALHAEKRAQILEAEIEKGKTVEELLAHDVGRELITPDIHKKFYFENRDVPDGYAMLNGYKMNARMILRYPVEEGTEIVLASDGYPVTGKTLEQSEMALASLLQKDPLCFRFNKQMKGRGPLECSYDDRTYWRGIV
ncbi:MAG: hypothetical protein J6M58_05940 [Clostridium sp.]|nr:hypothetical protein [Clostridium sp.]MBP3215757.1 hypothetical protein [Clostridium sp.]